ncbi:MAG: YggS family pyridoxal phosphate-dependent enzyme [Parachlamydiaceae bacterium]
MKNDPYIILKEQITAAAQASGRLSNDITLVAVTKTIPWENCSRLYDCGQRDFGEGRLAEALKRKEVAPPDCRWHFIGTLQSNKVRKAIGQFALIHSVDTLPLARKIAQCSIEAELTTKILLQVNVSMEASKHGFSIEELKQNYEEIVSLKGISVEGLMTMAPAGATEDEARYCFASLRHFRDELKERSPPTAPMNELSMGMSQDFLQAIAEGATIVRVGSRLHQT